MSPNYLLSHYGDVLSAFMAIAQHDAKVPLLASDPLKVPAAPAMRDDLEAPALQAAYDPRRWVGWRHGTAALLSISYFLCFADRTSIGVVLAESHFPNIPIDEKGNILSAFFVGYFCTQLLGGFWARRYGSKFVVILGTLIWAVFTMLTPVAATLGLPSLLFARFNMGLGEGMLLPTQLAISSFWFPTQERAFLMAIVASGAEFGSVLASVISPILVKINFWFIFPFWGVPALIWCVVYAFLGSSAPEVHKQCKRSGEAEWIQAHRDAPDWQVAKQRVGPVLPVKLLLEPSIWAIFAGHVGVNYAWFVMTAWMPSFFQGSYDLDLAQNGILMSVPYIAATFGLICGGRLSDAFTARGYRARHVRKGMQLTGAVANALLLQVACRSKSPVEAVVWISLASFLGKLQNSGYAVSMVDVCPESAATVMGMSNMVATIPGIVGQPITQAILSGSGGEGSRAAWSVVFGIGGAVAIIGACIFAAFADDVPLEGKSGGDATEPGLAACAAQLTGSTGTPETESVASS